MNHPGFDRNRLLIRKLAERKNQVFIEKDHLPIITRSRNLSKTDKHLIGKTAERIRSARGKKRSVILAFGAHTIKNGLAPVLTELIKEGWVTHLATNGAGIIHDWNLPTRENQERTCVKMSKTDSSGFGKKQVCT